MKGQVIDEFLFAKYIETNGKGVTMLICLFFIPLQNMIPVAKDDAATMVLFIVCCIEIT